MPINASDTAITAWNWLSPNHDHVRRGHPPPRTMAAMIVVDSNDLIVTRASGPCMTHPDFANPRLFSLAHRAHGPEAPEARVTLQVARSILLIIFVSLLCGCGSAPTLKHDPQFLRQHVITVDGQGRPHDPASADGREYTMAEYRSQIAGIFVAMNDFHQAHGNNKVLIFVHGGMNAPQDSLQSADAEMDHVIAAGYFPIYLDWNSDLMSSYGEHITSITQGQTDNSFGRHLLTPFYLIADMLRAVVRTPIVWVNQAAGDINSAAGDVAALPHPPTDAKSQRWAQGSHGQAVAQTYNQLLDEQRTEEQHGIRRGQRQQLRIYIGPDLDVNPWHMAGLGAVYVITIPTKFLSQPFIDWLGTPAWQDMSRRTLIAFDGDLGGNPSNPNLDPQLVGQREMRGQHAVDFSSTGALEVFREELHEVVENRHATTKPATHPTTQPDSSTYDITLIGHSMGTMVLNEWLRRDLLESKSTTYSNIVYMGAACSVRDFSRAAVPYLLQHQQTQFYNLMLHPLAELRERNRAYDTPPRGSLLVWLDTFLTDPQTPLDRTMGRWDNIIPATEVIPQSVRGRVTLKAFALAPYNDPTPPPGQPDYGPQEHGQFRGRPYWCKEFWSSETPIIPAMDCRNESPPTTQPHD
jgi:hypothetical protein